MLQQPQIRLWPTCNLLYPTDVSLATFSKVSRTAFSMNYSRQLFLSWQSLLKIFMFKLPVLLTDLPIQLIKMDDHKLRYQLHVQNGNGVVKYFLLKKSGNLCQIFPQLNTSSASSWKCLCTHFDYSPRLKRPLTYQLDFFFIDFFFLFYDFNDF